MLKDITFGQYFPTDSVVHKMDPRTKILLLMGFIVFTFVCNNFFSLIFLALSVIAVISATKIPFVIYLKNFKAILPVVIFATVLNMFYVKTGHVLVDWWILTITVDGILRAAFMTLRVVLLIMLSAVFSYTTTPTSITNALESLLKPLKYLKLESAVHVFSMAMTITLRFIPTLIEETEKIMNAQKARGADVESGNLLKRAKALIPILIPLFISSIHHAYDLAESMECRCYVGGAGRTKYNKTRYSRVDALGGVCYLLICGVIILLNILF